MTEKKTSDRVGTIFKIMFFVVCVFSLLTGLYLSEIVNDISNLNDPNIEYIDNWTVIDNDGKSFQVGSIYNDDRAYTEDFTIISRLPETLEPGSMLCFMNRSDVKVYINGSLRMNFVRARDTGLPGGSLKEFYIVIPLDYDDANGELEIFRGKTDWNPIVVPETFVSSGTGVFRYVWQKHGMPFAMAVVLFVAAIFVTIIGVVLRIWKRQNIDMLYAALGILDVACWLLSVSQITPFITGIHFVDGIMGFLFCMMMPFGLLIYLDSIQRGRYKKLNHILFLISLISFALWTVLHFTGIRSFQSSLVYIDSELGIVVLCIFATLIIDIKRGYVSEYRYTAIGFLVFMVMAIVQIVFLIFIEKMSNEIPMQIGLFTLLLLVSVQQMEDIRLTRDHLEEEIRQKTIEKEQLLINIVKTLAGTIDAKDTYTNGHSSRVAEYSREIARRYGYSDSAQNDIYIMGLLHDIGKIGIPDAVINKPSKLTDEEYDLIKTHPVVGANILSNIREKSELAIGARWHHEKYGGGGYPDGLKGTEIPEQARIIAVADSYDAMTSYRSYRAPMPQVRVKEEIINGIGTQFDECFAKIMLEMIDEDRDYDMRERKKKS